MSDKLNFFKLFSALNNKKVGRPQDIADVYYLRKIEKEWGNE